MHKIQTGMKGNILLVEDDPNLGFVTKDSLEVGGFQVTWYQDGGEVSYEELEEFDLCILDIMLPREDGFTIASKIRSRDEFVPIIFLTARGMEEDRLKGFEIGGDDYVVKPFSIKELIYRIEVFVRRSRDQVRDNQKSSIESIGRYTFDRSNLTLSIEDSNQTLTRMEGELLDCLLKGKNGLVNRSEILIKVWGEDDYFKGRSLDVFISRLRKYLKQDENLKIDHFQINLSI